MIAAALRRRRRSGGWWLCCCLAATLGATEAPVLRFAGTVHADRRHVTELEPPAEDLVITGLCESGRRLRHGDPLIVFDNGYLRQRLERRRRDLALERRRRAHREAEFARELAALQEQREDLRAELAVARARLARIERHDAAQLRLCRAEARALGERLARQRRTVVAQARMQALGQIAARELASARARLRRLEREHALAQERVAAAQAGPDPLALDEARLAVTELLDRLGSDPDAPDGPEAPKRGLAKQIAALTARITSERAKADAAVRRSERELQQALRETWDHTPVSFVELHDASGEAVRRVVFQPDGTAAPAGWAVDHGAAYDPERGFGWQHTRTDQIDWQDVPADAGLTARLQAGALIVRSAGRWRCDLPPGTWQLRLGLGARHPWQGSLVRHAGTVLACRALESAPRVIEQTITLDQPGLVLEIGDDHPKAMRAPADGVAVIQRWPTIAVGTRVWRKSHPLAFFYDPEHYVVRTLVHQRDVHLLRTKPAPEAIPGPDAPMAERIAAVRRAMATQTVRLHSAAGLRAQGTVQHIDSTPLAFARGSRWDPNSSDNRRDLVARAVTIALPPEARERVRYGQSIACSARLAPPPAGRLLPGHQVLSGPRADQILLADELVPVRGFRAGAHYVVLAGLPPGSQPAVPLDRTVADPHAGQTYPATVVAGRKTEVGFSHWWGRVESLVSEGSRVEEGQLVITLYNPSLESERERTAEAKVKALQDHLVAIETRREKAVQAQLEHRRKLSAERRTSLELARLRRPRSLVRAERAEDLRQAREEAARLAQRADDLQLAGVAAPGELARARHAARLAALAHDRARLEQVAEQRRVSVLDMLAARDAWHAAPDA
ncbi:MAG: hypothetical protein ACOCYV_02290, partial [Planctomycetota bacterium]